jgi:hypothetical protein
MRLIGRLVLVLIGFSLGAGTSLATLALHQSWLWLAVAAAATLAVLLALPRGGWLRLSFALGWTVIVLAAVLGRPEGDYVLGAEGHAYTVLIGGLGVLIGATLLSVSRGAGRA